MNARPNKWVAAILALVSPLLGMVFVAQPMWAAIYFFAGLLIQIQVSRSLQGVPVAALAVAFAPSVACAIHAYRFAGAYPAGKPRPLYSRWYGVTGVAFVLFASVIGFRMFLFEPFRAPSASMAPAIRPGEYLIAQKWGYGHYGTLGLALFKGQATSELRRGDIVVFDRPRDESIQFVKRVIGLPGDQVIYRDKQLTVNGKNVPHVKNGDYLAMGPRQMPEKMTRYAESLDGSDYSVAIKEDAPRIIPAAVEPFPFQEKCIYDDHGVTCEVPAGHYFMMGDNRDNSRDSRYWGFVPADHIVGKVVYVLR